MNLDSGLSGRLELGGRWDSGDAEEGLGIDIGGELSYHNAYLDITTQGHWLAVHEEQDFYEWGASVSMSLRSNPSGYGVHFSLTPSWGVRDRSEVQGLWEQDVLDRSLVNGGEGSGSLGMSMSYGIGLGNLLLSPYSELDIGSVQSLRVGTRLHLLGGWRDRIEFHVYGE